MIRLLVVYPRSDGTKFDADYWTNTHMATLSAKMPKLLRWEADVAGPDTPYHALAHLYFASRDDLGEMMSSAGGAEMAADVANYTDIQPQVTTHEVVATS